LYCNDQYHTPSHLNQTNDVNRLALALQEIDLYKNYDDAYRLAERLMSEMDTGVQQIREDKVSLARERIKSRYYFKKQVLSQIADKILIDLRWA